MGIAILTPVPFNPAILSTPCQQILFSLGWHSGGNRNTWRDLVNGDRMVRGIQISRLGKTGSLGNLQKQFISANAV